MMGRSKTEMLSKFSKYHSLQLSIKKEVIEKSLQFKSLESDYKKSVEYFHKSNMSARIFKSLESKYNSSKKLYLKEVKELEKQQSQYQKNLDSILKKCKEYEVLCYYDKFLTNDEYDKSIITITKAHKQGLLTSSRFNELLIEKAKFKRLEVGSEHVYVRDNRTQYGDIILINDKNEILFCIRNKNDDFEPGKYCLPGGHVDSSENPKAAAVRELEEETGIKIDMEYVSSVGNYIDDKVNIHYFIARSNEHPLVLEEREQSQYEWVPLNQIGEKPLLRNLEENLRNIINIPRIIVNPQESSASKYYFGGELIKSQEEYLLQDSIEVLSKSYNEKIINKGEYVEFLSKINQPIEKYIIVSKLRGVRHFAKLEKAKYIKREGTKGNYKYIYPENKNNKESSLNSEENSLTLENKPIEIDYEKLKGLTDKILSNSGRITRLNPEEEQGRIRGGRKNVEASILLGTDESSDKGDKQTSGSGYEVVTRHQEDLLEKYAKKTGSWFDYSKDINRWDYIDSGEEAEVFVSPDSKGYINKVIRYNKLDDMTPLEFIDNRISLHNYLFPDTKYELLGFSRDNKKEFVFVLKQPYIQKSEEEITKKEVDSYLEKKLNLFPLTPNSKDYTNASYSLDDIHSKNVIKGKDGDLYFIDTLLSLNESGEELGGNRSYEDFKVIDNEIIKKGRSIAQIGEIREWEGIKMKKVSPNKWEPVTEVKTTKIEEESEKPKSTQQDQSSDKPKSVEELKTYARQTSTENLNQAAEGADEQLRIVAKEELSRRETEETLNQESKVQEDNELSKVNNLEERLSSKYKETVEKLLDPKIYESNKESEQVSNERKELARYIRRVKQKDLFVATPERQQELAESLGLENKTQLKELFGDGDILLIGSDTTGDVKLVQVVTNDNYCERVFFTDSKKVEMSEFILNPELEKGQGIGSKIFYNQVSQFRNLGYKKLVTDAAKGENYNGYYTWAVLGYEFKDKDDRETMIEWAQESDNERIRNATTLSEMVSFKEGAEWWRKNGFAFEGVFDLDKDSNSMKLLDNYMNKKKE